MKVYNFFNFQTLSLFMMKPFLLFFCSCMVFLSYGLWRRERIKMTKYFVFLVFLLVIFVLGSREPIGIPQLNSYKLLSFKPNSKKTWDFTGDKRKDHYPRCVFQYNSLGYRDVEPSFSDKKKHKILIIGDSYIWGDGIPSNDQTLAALLRNDLDKSMPGKFMVISAAFPGLGLYGYFEFLKKLKPHIRPDLVMFGYLGDSDFDPFDFQMLVEKLPVNVFLKNMILNFHIIQHIHEISVINSKTLWFSQGSVRSIKKLLNEVADYSRRENVRVVLIRYMDGRTQVKIPGQIGIFDLPHEFSYKGKSSKLWYAKDNHPKPLLNKYLARMLSDKIIMFFKGDKKTAFHLFQTTGFKSDRKDENTNIKALLTKRDAFSYRITLHFSAPMKSGHSFLCSFKVVDVLWKNPYEFQMIVESAGNADTLSLTINPEGYSGGFTTEDDVQLPMQVISLNL